MSGEETIPSAEVRPKRSARIGPVLVLVGVVIYLVACFMPYGDFKLPPEVQSQMATSQGPSGPMPIAQMPSGERPGGQGFLSFIDLFSTRTLFDTHVAAYSGINAVGGFVGLFAGIAVVALLSVIALLADDPHRASLWLVSAVAAWGLTFLGSLVADLALVDPAVGYWFLLLGLAVVVAGASVALVTTRAGSLRS